MDRVHTFVRDEVLASYFENMWDAALSVLSSNFAVTILDATHLRVPASPGVGASVVSIQGRPRWVEANVDRAHPGGAAGTYDVFVTAADQSISNAPAPYTDSTNYSFALAIVASGATPPIVAGTVDIFRKVASCQWDGAQITEIDPVVNSAPAGWPASGPATQATLRKLDQTATGATAGNDPRVPTQAENDALQGTSGAPANGNRFVTDADPRNANARTPTGAAGGDHAGTYPNPTVVQSSGHAWPGNAGWLYLKLVGGGALLWDPATGGVILRNNYDPATDRLLVAANPSWQLRLRSSTDQTVLSRAPATAGSPVYADVATFAATGLVDARFTARYFGDGSDGVFTLDGAVTPAWATRAGSVYTMTRDCQCTTLTVNAGVTLKSNGYRVFCSVAFNNAGTVSNDGGNGGNGGGAVSLPGAAGAGAPGTTVGAGGNGGLGGTTAGANPVLPGSGAAGASANGGGQTQGGSGGAGGNPNSAAAGSTSYASALRRAGDVVLGVMVVGGLGGGGGGAALSGGFANGGGGGGGGGIVLIAALAFTNTGTITAKGGNGGNASGSNSGGGGGGGGGAVLVVAASGALGTTSVTGGTGSAVTGGTGTAGGNGAAGNAALITVSS